MTARGFTLIELLITLSILAVLTTLVIPVVQIQVQRSKEESLRIALRDIRGAIDSYKRASDEGRIRKDAGSSGYPRTLKQLIEGVEDQAASNRRKMFFLRQIPRDPFYGGLEADDDATWALRAYSSEANDPKEGEDVYDVRSRSTLLGLNGVPLKRW